MAPPVRPLELELLCQHLDAEFGPLIQGRGSNAEERRRNFYSQALPAFVLMQKAGATRGQAVAASIDGGGDRGVDAVFVGADRSLWILQAKYIDNGRSEPPIGEADKFCNGARALLRSEWQHFNAALQAKSGELTRALDDETCRVQVLMVHTGGAASDDRRAIFGALERDFNATEKDFLRCACLGLASLHDLRLDGLAAGPISADVELRGYGHAEQPLRALYGRLPAQKLAELHAAHGDALVDRNLRRFKGSTSVNDGLSDTLRQNPAHFFYFNNGVTFLCDTFTQVGPRDPTRDIGRFRISGLSVINGAQTVGAIAGEAPAYYAIHPCEVLATFVCLQAAPDGFGDQVTQYRNRQNAVDLEDFAALDENQQHWRQTLAMANIDYVVKPGERETPSDDPRAFSAREAAPVLACGLSSHAWADYVVAAKADRKRLFMRPGLGRAGKLADAYAAVFAHTLTARELWRSVQIGRLVQSALTARAASEQDPESLAAGTLRARDVLREGRWLALHLLFVKTELHRGADLALTQADQQRISSAIDQIADRLVTAAQAQPWNKQARAVFENPGDCQTLKAQVMAQLTQPL